MESWFCLAYEDEAYDIGYTVGQFIPFILLLIGILKCQQIISRPTANTKAVGALMIVLIMLLVACALGVISKHIQVNSTFQILSAFLTIGGLMTGVLLAIMGVG